MYSLNCKGRLLDLSLPIVMGILNATPDSFYSGSRVQVVDTALLQAEKMIAEGAVILDIGGASSRPGAEMPKAKEELNRVLPIIEKISEEFPNVFLSIDTWRGEVAKAAVEAGVHIVNDISAGSMDDSLLPTVADLNVPYILMHMQGKPNTMQHHPDYQDVTVDILDFFIKKIEHLHTLGIHDVVLDVGFGFGKTIEHNFQLLKKMHAFRILDKPVLAGISRKSMIYKYLGNEATDALNGTTALHMIALQQGAKILRVHDVKEAVECVKLWEKLENS